MRTTECDCRPRFQIHRVYRQACRDTRLKVSDLMVFYQCQISAYTESEVLTFHNVISDEFNSLRLLMNFFDRFCY